MNSAKVFLAIVALSLCGMPVAHARLIREIGYQELFDGSDLIVIARPGTKTADTNERPYFADITRTDERGRQARIAAIGVETTFEVSKVIKGNGGLKRFVLHHYREASPPSIELNGPLLVSFDPSDASRRRDILLFLVKEKDGRYAPYAGQTDPGGRTIFALEVPR
jgi:hypothetical protein